MNRLEEIIAHKRGEVAAKHAAGLKKNLEPRVEAMPRARDFTGSLAGDNIRLIAEIKKASPSAGLIRPNFDPPKIAGSYANAGAAALSILTDERFFQGHLDHLIAVRAITAIPCLQKDFVIDEIQLYEARAAGADAILLIVAALDDGALRFLFDKAIRLGLHVLTEVHDEAELERAVRLGAPVIGINNRDLTRMETSLSTTARLIAGIPDDRIVVSESGIKTAADVQTLRMLGVDAILVGESLLREPDLEAAVRKLMGMKMLTD